jgi:hypothetical protein
VAALHTFKQDVARDMRSAVARAVERVKADAKARCPVGAGTGPFPGHLRDQIRSQMVPDAPQGAVFVERRGIGGAFGTDNVGIWAEYGTNVRSGKRGYHGRMPARPFMGPAAELERPRHLADLQAVLDKAARSF